MSHAQTPHPQTPHVRRSHPDTAPAQTAEGDTPGVHTPGTPGNGDRIDVGLQRILKRETRSSRAGMAALAAALVIAACLYALLESALRAIGQPPWLIDPQTAAERLTALPGGISPLLLGALGGVVAMVGLIFFLNAVLPGRKSRHLLEDPRAGVVVDD